MKRIIYLILALIVLLFGLTFTVENQEAVHLKYYFGFQWGGPLSLLLFVVFALGVVMGYLASLKLVLRMQRQLVAARREVRQAEQEVANLRALPIKDGL